MPNRERKRVPDDRSDILKGSLPKSPPAHPWDTKIRVSEAERREREENCTVSMTCTSILNTLQLYGHHHHHSQGGNSASN